MKSRTGLLLIKSSFAVAMLLSCLLVVDLVLRATLPIPKSGSGDWAGPPRTSLTLTSSPDNFESVHRYHSLGFRGSEITLSKRVAERIVCIGDSWTEGIGASESQTWPSMVAQKLPKDQFEVINLGDAGATPERYLEILTKVGVALQPTMCVVCLNTSDLYGGPAIPKDTAVRTTIRDEFRDRNSSISTLAAYALPGWMYLVDRSQGRWHQRQGVYWNQYEIPFQALAHLIAERSGLPIATAEGLLNQRIPNLEPACVEAAKKQAYNGYRIDLELLNPHASFKCTTTDMAVSEDKLNLTTNEWLAFYATTCQAANIRPVLCLFPEAGLVSRDPVGPMVDDFYLDAPDISSDQSISNMLRRICSNLGIAYMDCTEELRSHANEPLFLRYDGHPNARAYELVGEWVAPQLQRY